MSVRRRYVAVPLVASILALTAVALGGGVSVAAKRGGRKTERTPITRARHDTWAYGLVVPPCSGCGKLPKSFSPLSRTNSMNVELGVARSNAPLGSWCFALKDGINPATVAVVPSVVSVEGPRTRRFSQEMARWVVGAPDCSPSQIEIRTFGYVVEGSDIVAVPSSEIAFSFVIN